MPIRVTVTPSDHTWIVRAEGVELAVSRHALELRDGDDPAVICFPREDVAMVLFEPSQARAARRHLGPTLPLTLVGPDRQIEGAAWSIETPEPALARLAGHVAFDDARVTLERL